MKKYLITSREFYTDTPAIFRSILHEQFAQHLPDYALYRDKSNPNYKTQAQHFVEVCSQFESVKSMIHQDIKLAKELGAYGVHLNSKQMLEITLAKELGLHVAISTHTKEEVLQAQKLKADYVTYSPIFTTPNKGTPKGVEDLKSLVEEVEIKIFALGGIITPLHVEQIRESKSYGFASIRYFY